MSFGGINTMRSALQANQRSLQIIGHNVANANTAGYSRQAMSLVAGEPVTKLLSGGQPAQFGTGVREAEIIRYRNDFLDRQFRNRNALAGFHEGFNIGLVQMELIFNEPTEAGLRVRFDDFWEAVQNLNNRPGDLDTRIQFRERAGALVDHARFVYKQLSEARQSYDTNMIDKIAELNSSLRQVAALNERITRATAGGQSAGDLEDRRDILLDNLSRLAGATISKNSLGDVSVWIDNQIVVSNVMYAQVTQERLPGSEVTTFHWDITGDPATFTTGEVGALQHLRDATVPDYVEYLDTMIRTFAERINEVHRDGYGLDSVSGRNLFAVGPGPLNIAIDPLILQNSDWIAAAKAPEPPATTVSVGDSRNAWDMLQVRDEAILSGGLVGTRSVTAYDYLRAMNTLLGIQSQDSRRNQEAYQLQASQANDLRMSVSGVSLDEEMTKMIEHQHAYNAAARVITALDEAIGQVIDRMGIVGR